MSTALYNQALAREIANDLLSIKAIKLQPNDPFTWASGWKSPIYCDNRLSLSFPDVREKITKHLAAAIQENFDSPDAISGVATAGLPQGALISAKLGLPFSYVRSKAKGHGLGNQIEGKVDPGSRVVVVEDLISTGGSSLEAVEALRAVGVEVLGIVSIFSYGFNVATDNLASHKVNLVHLSDYDTLLDLALEKGQIDEDHKALLAQWKSSPQTWGK